MLLITLIITLTLGSSIKPPKKLSKPTNFFHTRIWKHDHQWRSFPTQSSGLLYKKNCVRIENGWGNVVIVVFIFHVPSYLEKNKLPNGSPSSSKICPWCFGKVYIIFIEFKGDKGRLLCTSRSLVCVLQWHLLLSFTHNNIAGREKGRLTSYTADVQGKGSMRDDLLHSKRSVRCNVQKLLSEFNTQSISSGSAVKTPVVTAGRPFGIQVTFSWFILTKAQPAFFPSVQRIKFSVVGKADCDGTGNGSGGGDRNGSINLLS